MIKHAWSVLCTRVLTDKDSNNVSLDVAEQFTIRLEIPGKGFTPGQRVLVPFPLRLVTLLYRDDSGRASEPPPSGQLRITVLSPDGGELGHLEARVEIPLRRLRSIADFGGLPVADSGYYVFRVALAQGASSDFEEVARIPLEIVLTGSPPITQH